MSLRWTDMRALKLALEEQLGSNLSNAGLNTWRVEGVLGYSTANGPTYYVIANMIGAGSPFVPVTVVFNQAGQVISTAQGAGVATEILALAAIATLVSGNAAITALVPVALLDTV